MKTQRHGFPKFLKWLEYKLFPNRIMMDYIDSEVEVIPFISYLTKNYDCFNDEQRKEALSLIKGLRC